MLNYLVFTVFGRMRAAALSKKKYDAVLVYQTSPVMAVKTGSRVAKKNKVPLTTMAIDLWPDCFFREMDMQSILLRKLFSGISRRNYLKSDSIITLNDRAADYFKRELGFHQSKVSVMQLGPSLPQKA